MIRKPVSQGIRVVAYALIPAAVFAGAYHFLRRISVHTVAKAEFSDAEQVSQVTDAFRLYAQAFDERFPEIDRFHGDELMAAIKAKMKLPALAGHSPRWGFSHLAVLQRTDPTFRYYGSGSRLGEADRVLVHWATTAGKNQVIFADMSHREVDALGLASLLSPWHRVANQCIVRIGEDGSGTVVSSDGLIITADHVVPADNSAVDIHFADGRSMPATVVERSKRLDVTLLRIRVAQPIPFVVIDSSTIAGSQSVWAIGYPMGRLDPLVREATTTQTVLDELITTWNNVSGGDSGGALLDAKGHLVGVILGPADPHRRTLRAAASPSVRNTFPILSKLTRTHPSR